MSSAAKLAEAGFFLELLDALEKRKRPLTHGSASALEVSYLLGAVLNSLYSALEQAKPFTGVEAIKAYKAAHSTLLGGQGIRNITIHEKHVGIDHSGYIPPQGDAVNFDLRKTPRLVQEERSASKGVALHIGATHYIEYEGKLTDVTELCFQQFYELRAFLISCGVVTQQGAQADSPASGVPAA
ncbi:hypothetical protein [Candidatus Aalborgicola defluviihabitans]|uniref:hypothetical protein n=1 Tax=Candidatus Aalborgicola defluviihabitans TaxID=3386187 RepID=UPI001D353C1F|nr:hypothetical protein [Burkholderiales bacterium]MBK6570852.1 hypothetical protein [Burkholderiales bacterium]MBK7312470.1 hypothetical protein [Burkholderiales bacterium]MBL0243279.1 hypothetical protein [Rhodoferax sp.]